MHAFARKSPIMASRDRSRSRSRGLPERLGHKLGLLGRADPSHEFALALAILLILLWAAEWDALHRERGRQS
jgi:hypothetical protein